jgi:hypothetical protein
MDPLADVTAIDHGIAALLLVLLPLYARRNFARLRAGLRAGDRDELVSRSESLQERVRERFAVTGLAALVPANRAEMRSFSAMALSAGVWEELLFRGFLIAWFAHWIGPAMAVVAAAVSFGIGHLYQGGAGVAKTTVAGLMAGGLYLLTGSLWIPMILHTAVDLHAGALGYLAGVARTEPQEDTPCVEPSPSG